MEDEVISAIVGTLVGVILGAAGTYLLNTASWRRGEAQLARLQLVGVRSAMWADAGNYSKLMFEVHQARTRCTAVGISNARLDAFEETAQAVWRESEQSLEQSGGQVAGVALNVLESFRSEATLIDADLSEIVRRPGFLRKKPRED